jgi:hypothetical protein
MIRGTVGGKDALDSPVGDIQSPEGRRAVAQSDEGGSNQ